MTKNPVMHPRCYHLQGPSGVRYLSRKKTRIGSIEKGFHFLGINYPETQTLDNTTVQQANKQSVNTPELSIIQANWGGKTTEHLLPEPNRIAPHPRTLRKAHEQVKQMVINGVSLRRISNYLYRWSTWWAGPSECWDYLELLGWFFNACRESNPAAGLLLKAKTSYPVGPGHLPDFESGYAVAL